MAKQRIDKPNAIALMGAYALQVREMNPYTFRLTNEEVRGVFFDWYHTTGSLVKNENGYPQRYGTYLDVEDCAIFVNREIYKRLK